MAEAKVRIGFIGAGRVGGALAALLHSAGYPVVAVASRSPESAQALASLLPDCRAVSAQEVADSCDLVFITTPDSAIREVSESVSWHPGMGVVHTSGAESRQILEKAERDGASTGSVHPLQTFADGAQARANLPASVFGVEAEGDLKGLLLELVAALRGTAIEIGPEEKPLYHLAAVLVSNHTVTLAKLATDLWQGFGWERQAALRALLPLLKGAVNNLEALGLQAALTGPIARGDVATIERHFDALEQAAPGMLGIYRELVSHTIPIALEKGGLSREAAADLARTLDRGREAVTVKGVSQTT